MREGLPCALLSGVHALTVGARAGAQCVGYAAVAVDLDKSIQTDGATNPDAPDVLWWEKGTMEGDQTVNRGELYAITRAIIENILLCSIS